MARTCPSGPTRSASRPRPAGTSRRVSQALPEWNVVMMPPLNYGNSGANQLGGMMIHPGTYAIRQSTLRSLVADLGAQLAQNGFKWIFVVNGHGAPTHHIAINEACDFVSETFRVTMLHLSGVFGADEAIRAKGSAINAKHFSAKRDRFFRFGCSCWRRRDVGHARGPARFGSRQLQNTSGPGRAVSRGVA